MPILNLALESVQHQSRLYFNELTLAFDDLKDVPTSMLATSPILERIVKITQKQTGLNTLLVVDNQGPCVYWPQINKNNVLIDDFVKNFVDMRDQRHVFKDGKPAVGTVDSVNAKVTGAYTLVQSPIHFPKSMIKDTKVTAEMLAAIYLHEIGHLFSFYECMSRMMRTNVVLEEIGRMYDGSYTAEQRTDVLIRAKDYLKLKDVNPAELAKVSKKEAVATVIVDETIKITVSELGANVYDNTNWEYLADQFAARHGAARPLAIALELIYREYGMIISTPLYLFGVALQAFGFMLAIVGSGGFLLLLIGLMGLFYCPDNTYDRPAIRFRRIRDQVVDALKNRDLSEEHKRQFLDELKLLDSRLLNIHDHIPAMDIIIGWMSKHTRDYNKALGLQQELERLAANKLFASSAELSLTTNEG